MKPNHLIKALFSGFFSICLLLTSAEAFPISAQTAKAASGEDAGKDYQDRLVFFGESTTQHLRQRSNLHPDQVWHTPSGTAKLDRALLCRPIIEDASGNLLTVAQAAEQQQPDILVLSFGLNGIIRFMQDPQSYQTDYLALIHTLQTASPQTHMILQSVYPVACNELQTDWKFSLSPERINQEIGHLNDMLQSICNSTDGLCYADTASVLRDENGFLKREYTTDGIHLTEDAYVQILHYLRTHAWQEENR